MPSELHVLLFGDERPREAVACLLEALPGVRVHVLRPADAGSLPGAARCVVAALGTPEPGAVQALGVIAQALLAPALVVLADFSESAAERLFAAGAHDVLPLAELTLDGLRHALTSGVRREAHRQAGALRRQRAARKGDALSALAAADDRAALFSALGHGLVALGALHVACWEDCAGAYQLLVQHGAEPEALGSPELRAEAVHQRAAAAALGHATWHVAPIGEACELGARGFIPVCEPGRPPSVIALTCDAPPSDDERAVMVELVLHAEASLARVDALAALRRELADYQRLLGEVSHDLRDPLNTLLLGARVMSERAGSDVARSLSRLVHAASVATRVVDDLDGFARGHGELSLQRMPGELYELLAAAVSDARARFGPRRAIQLELPEGEGACSFDLPRMEQALGNLIAYALTHSQPGSALRVRAFGDDHAHYVEVEGAIHDRARSELPTLLDVDVRAARVAPYGSGGIGLFIAARIVDAHGGRVWFEPRSEPTSVLCVQLPRGEPEARSPQVARLRSAPPARLASSAPPPLTGALLTLSKAIQAEPLRAALALWSAAREQQPLPHPLSLDRRALLPLLPDMVWVSVVELSDGQVCFRLDELGARLERRLGRTLSGARVLPTLDALSTSQHAAYHRCWEIRGPAYDYVRERGPRGFLMERLLLPLSRDGSQRIHQLAGVIVFSGGTP